MASLASPRIAAVAISACLLSACTASDYYYSTGPWGPRNVWRTPPTYGGPWNPALRRSEDVPVYIDAGGMDPTLVDVTPPPSRIIVALPDDPIPPGPAPAPSDETEFPEQGRALDNQSPTRPRMLAAASPDGAGALPPPRSASAYAGNWRAVDSGGRACKVQLSSRTSIDRYRASTSGCGNSGLGAVNLWSFKDGSVTLHAHEQIVATLSGKEADLTGSFSAGQGGIKMSR